MEQRRVPSKIKDGIDSQVGFFQFVGNLFELYLPRMIDLFVHRMSNKNENTTGNGSSSNGAPKYPNQ